MQKIVLYGCEIRLSLGEEYKLRTFENKTLERILGLKTNEVIGERRKLSTEKL
jgi:hypothetical protein